MIATNRKEPFVLVAGDLIVFAFSLFLALVIRYNQLPTSALLDIHLAPFGLIFAISVAVFFIAGLYDKQTVLLRKHLPQIIINAHLANALIAIVFFYFIPFFLITPKTNLFLYLIISLGLMFIWRVYGYQRLGAMRHSETGIIVADKKISDEVEREIMQNQKYRLTIQEVVDVDLLSVDELGRKIREYLQERKISFVIIDFGHDKVAPILVDLYGFIFSPISFIHVVDFYEELFDRLPVLLLRHDWFLRNISSRPKVVFDFVKRFMDILAALVLGAVSLVFYPLVYFAIKIDDGGPLFVVQKRIGENDMPITLYKFRSMKFNDDGRQEENKQNSVTRVGALLRRTRIDELPQLCNVLKGDLSLIGPRPELPALVSVYEREIPYYSIRHIVKPGLSGWAQIYHKNHPHHQTSVVDTSDKLSYDLFYIKNRSIMLDIKIALRTIRTLLSRSGV